MSKTKLYVGLILIVAGALFLLDNLYIINFRAKWIIGMLFILGGVAFFGNYLSTKQYWNIFPAVALSLIGLSIILADMRYYHRLIGTLWLWGIASGFLLVYARHKNQWWAVIPGGVLLTVGSIPLLDQLFWISGRLEAFVLFFGISLTFGFLYFIRDEKNKLDWAKYPALATLIFACFILLISSRMITPQIVLSVALIVVGSYIIYRNLRKKNAH